MERKTDLANEEWVSAPCVAAVLIIVNSLIGLNNLGKYLVKWIQSESKLWPTTFFLFSTKKNTLHHNCLCIFLIPPLSLEFLEEEDPALLMSRFPEPSTVPGTRDFIQCSLVFILRTRNLSPNWVQQQHIPQLTVNSIWTRATHVLFPGSCWVLHKYG